MGLMQPEARKGTRGGQSREGAGRHSHRRKGRTQEDDEALSWSPSEENGQKDGKGYSGLRKDITHRFKNPANSKQKK